MTTKITEQNISNVANAAIQWQAVVTADGSTNTNAVAGQGYFVDTSSAQHTVVLPASPNVGDTIVIRDFALTFDTNQCNISRNGSKIEGFAADTIKITTEGISTMLVYSGDTRGWVVTHEGNKTNLAGYPQYVAATGGTVQTFNTDFKIHAFTGDGCFVVSNAGNADGSNKVEVLVVAGGGGGGAFYGGGGGAGGLVLTPSCGISVSAQTYPISVGGGGNGTNSNNVAGTNGSNSTGMGFTAVGGGYGAGEFGGGNSGGSGGGGNPRGGGGSGNQPSQSNPGATNFGNAGGPGPGNLGGGGGGATSAGGANPTCTPNLRAGGLGKDVSPQFGTYTQVNLGDANPAYASNQYYAGGGGGQGSGGGAGGGGVNPVSSGAGQANTGGGARGDSGGTAGGKGIVLIKYKFQN